MAALRAYDNPETGERIKPGAKLGDAYEKANLPVARERLYRAGLRLSFELNKALGGKWLLEWLLGVAVGVRPNSK